MRDRACRCSQQWRTQGQSHGPRSRRAAACRAGIGPGIRRARAPPCRTDDPGRAAAAQGIPPARVTQERLSLQGRACPRAGEAAGAPPSARLDRRGGQPQSGRQAAGGGTRQEGPLAIPLQRSGRPPARAEEVRAPGRFRQRAAAAAPHHRAGAAAARSAAREGDGVHPAHPFHLLHAPRQPGLREGERQLRHRHPAEAPRPGFRRHGALPLPRQGGQGAVPRAARPPRRAHRPRAFQAARQGALPVPGRGRQRRRHPPPPHQRRTSRRPWAKGSAPRTSAPGRGR